MSSSGKTYTELMKLQTYDERFEYLRTNSRIGEQTFGGNRYLNQVLYNSPEWRSFRNKIILRDNGCDMGLQGYPVPSGEITVHHLNEINVDDVLNRRPCVFDPENVVSVATSTHRKIHYYGGKESVDPVPKLRSEHDDIPWKRRDADG